MMTRTPENRQQKFLKILQVFQGRTKAAIAIKMKHNICMLVSTVSFILTQHVRVIFSIVLVLRKDVEAMFRAWRPFCSRGVFFFLGFKLREQRVLIHAGCHLSLHFMMSI